MKVQGNSLEDFSKRKNKTFYGKFFQISGPVLVNFGVQKSDGCK
jgi:hypothetical protein